MRLPMRRALPALAGFAAAAQPRRRVRPPGRRAAGGLATLATVLGLLALAAWAAAASQRAVLGELRAAGSHLRAAEAFEAAQGGLEFVLALLHAGPLDAACEPASAPAPSLAEQLESGTVLIGCQRLDNGWACLCPPAVLTAPTVALAPAAPAVPAFRVEARRVASSTTVHLHATGWGSGGHAVARLSMLASPGQGTSPPTSPPDWRRVPGSWRDF